MILLNKGIYIYGNVSDIFLYPKMVWGVILNSGISKNHWVLTPSLVCIVYHILYGHLGWLLFWITLI